MHKNTLYITFDGLSDPLGQSQILPYLCGVAANGIHVHILSCEKKERLEKEQKNIREHMAALPITWDFILYDEDGGTWSRWQYIQKIRKLAERIRQQRSLSLLHCRSYLASLIGLRFKHKYNIPFIFDMRGFWADERIDGGIWKRSNPIQNFFYSYFKKKEKQFLVHADAIVSLTSAAVKHLAERFPKDLPGKTTVIPCCTNTTLFNKALVHSKQIKGLSAEDHLLIYTGSIGTWYYTREMIDCVLSWKKHIPSIKLLILTKDHAALEAILDSYSAEQRALILCEESSHKDVASYLALAKAAIFFIKPAYSKMASSPTKMAECWAMDLPIITNSGIGDNDFYFKTYAGGVLLDNFTSADYEKACQNYLQLSRKEGAYRQIALDHFDTRMAVEKYSAIYDHLISKAC